MRRFMVVAIVVTVCAAATAAYASFVAAPGSPYGTGNEPYSVNPGSFTADALTDLAVVNGTSSTVDVFDQLPSDGGFGLAGGSPFSVGSGPNFAAVADFNGDGRQDLAVSNFTGNSISIMLRQPNDTFTEAAGSPVAMGNGAKGIATGDFNGDGKPDLAVALDNGSVAILLHTNAAYGFAAPVTYSVGGAGTTPRYVAVGDLDGANGPDLAVTDTGTDKVAVLLNQGGGTFAAAPSSPFAVGHQPQFVVIAPLDADSLPDIAVTNYGSNNVTVLDRQSGGGFQAESGSPYTVGTNPVGLAAADFDGSGHLDLVAANSGSDTFTILKNSSSTFTRETDVPVSPGVSPYGIATGLFNSSDAIPDVAVTTISGTDALGVFLDKPAPQATTLDATEIDDTSATLNATVNPQGLDTDAHFEYGTTTAYGSLAPAGGELAVGTDRTDHAVSRDVAGLAPSTTYHFRAVSSSGGGTVTGGDKTFTTPATPVQIPPAHDGSAKPPASTGSGPPQAYLLAPTEIVVGTPTVLSAEGSTPGGPTYRFDLDGSGTYATSTGTVPNLPTTFTTAGDVKVGLRVTDALGRTDTVRRTVHVTSPPVYGLTYTPRSPDVDEKVRFTVRQVIGNPANPGATVTKAMPDGATATMTYGDDTPTSGTVDGIRYTGRAASDDGDFAHTYNRSGYFKIRVGVDDGHGTQQVLDATIPVGHNSSYQPAIATDTPTVDQGSCVHFTNATADQLARQDTGAPVTEDINPANQIIQVIPDPRVLLFGGVPNPTTQPINFGVLSQSTFLSGSVFAQLALPSLNLSLAAGHRAKTRQAEQIQTTSGTDACQQWHDLQSTVADAVARKPPYPHGADVGWPAINSCPGGQDALTYAENQVSFNGTTRTVKYTRYGWFSINHWDFGDGTQSGADTYIPSSEVYHPYDKPGHYTVKLSTTLPRNLSSQLDDWNASCAKNPLNATKASDDRFVTRSTQMPLHVLALYKKITSRGLPMTTPGFFVETDTPGMYEARGPIYINDSSTSGSPVNLNGVLVVTPDDAPLKVVPDQGEIIGAAHLAWQSGGSQIALGSMPITIGGTPGLVLPPAGAGGTHDFGIFWNPPASLSASAPPPVGAAFHINSAHVLLRENNGGRIELNVHLPQPLGPNGGESDETIARDVAGGTRAASARGLFDNFDVDIPAIDLVPGLISFNGGKLSHHPTDNPPWQATGDLSVFGYDVNMSPDSKKPGCPVSGGLGFYDNGGLANAGAVVTGLQIPIPNPPDPDPVTALADPAFEIQPATSTRPLDLYGCLALEDYPAGDAFQLEGCAGFLAAGSGVSIPANEQIAFCPDQKGNQNFARTDHNSVADTAHPGNRILRGSVIRVSGDLGLGPDHFSIAQAYLEYRSDPFAVETQGHFGETFLDGHVDIGAEVFGYFRGLKDWAVGGEGGITQDLICVPFTDLCPSTDIAVLVGYKGIGACATIFGIGIGGSVTFSPFSLHGHFPGCDLQDLKDDLGVSIRGLPRYDTALGGANEPEAMPRQVQSGTVDLPGDTPYSLIVVNGTSKSPVVQVRDPDGKLVLDDTGAAVQGLTQPSAPPAGAQLPSQTASPPEPPPAQAPQGILHDDLTQYHDDNVDLRHTTLILIRAPKAGKYTITTKPGSAPITAISHSNALPQPVVDAGVVGSGSSRMLSLQSALPTGDTMTIGEESGQLSHTLTTVSAPAAGSRLATIARASRHVAFKPAEGPGGRRKLVAIVYRNGIPQHRIVVGSYRAPAAPKAGRVHRLRTKLRGSRLTVTWRPAAHVRRYVVRVTLRHGISIVRGLKAKAHRLVLNEALIRLGATVTVQAIGPLSIPGPKAKHRVRAVHVKRIKHFVV